ncbi:MAG TPA: PAS domain-containing protein, partial [Pyrinomonadaceae bacterium]|nr:PAS domain-containing protein [Pyrinomonadaceae bacterium]
MNQCNGPIQISFRYFSFFLYALSAYLIVGGTISFAAWPLDMPSWADWLGSGITIQPTASLASIASGIALLFRTRFGANRISFIFSVITFSIGAISLFQLFSGIDLGLNSLVTFEREWGRTLVVSPGQMGFPASASWTILGISLASISVNEIKRLPFSRQRLELLALAFGFAAVLVSLLSIVGYLYQVDTLFTLPRLTAIALQTATFILATGVGTVLSMTNAAPRRLLADPGTEGQVLRRLVPVVIIVPIALGHLTVLGTQSGLFEAPFGIAIRSVLEIAVLFTILILAVSAVKKQALRAAEFEVAAEERFRLAQKAGKVGVWDWKAETGETYWSDTMWELYDEEPTSKQASNIFWYERLHEDDVERVRSGVQATLNSTATEYVDEFRIVAKNGTSRWVDVR